MTTRTVTLLLTALFLALPLAAKGQPQIKVPSAGGGGTGQAEVFFYTTAETTKMVLEKSGFANVKISKVEKTGELQVVGTKHELPVMVWHYYKADKAYVVQFFVMFGKQPSIDINWVNSWNIENLWAKYTKWPDDTLVATMDYAIAGGVTLGNFGGAAIAFADSVKKSLTYKPKTK